MKLVVSGNEAAKMLSISRAKVTEYLEGGEIRAYKEGKYWKIPVKALEEFIEKKCKEKETSVDAPKPN